MNLKGYHKVSGKHKLYYEVYGNPDGIPILFLHGSPGMGFSERDKIIFDKRKFRVLFFDQRGASRSKPFGSIENNNTNLLVKDINSLTKALGFKKFIIFGGSWGSTLALVYAIKNPTRVVHLILRGIFLANKESIDYYIKGGVDLLFPKEWQQFKNQVPSKHRDCISKYYLKKMQSRNIKVAKKFAYEWSKYEMAIYKMNISDKEIEQIISSIPYLSLAKLEAHYMAKNCFLSENYILKNTAKINNIPLTIVQGRYDAICPPTFAYQLHQKLKKSKLFIVNAGHAASEPEIEKKLIQALEHI